MHASFPAARRADFALSAGASARLFADVPPEVLAREEACERQGGAMPGGNPWQTFLRRVLPALERQSPDDMAAALLAGGYGLTLARAHAAAMRRRALTAGDAGLVRFWSDVGSALVTDHN